MMTALGWRFTGDIWKSSPLLPFDLHCRFIYGSDPVSELMMIIGFIALIANVGVILAGGLVVYTGSRIPDLVIELIVATLLLRGGINILSDAGQEAAKGQTDYSMYL